MKTSFRKSFARDLKKLKDADVRSRVLQAIEEVEAADTLDEISHLKKLTGTSKHYRIRVGEFRIGLTIEGDAVDFVRCLDRKDLYRYFP
jgi:mRNA interferase RelE/StbE